MCLSWERRREPRSPRQTWSSSRSACLAPPRRRRAAWRCCARPRPAAASSPTRRSRRSRRRRRAGARCAAQGRTRGSASGTTASRRTLRTGRARKTRLCAGPPTPRSATRSPRRGRRRRATTFTATHTGEGHTVGGEQWARLRNGRRALRRLKALIRRRREAKLSTGDRGLAAFSRAVAPLVEAAGLSGRATFWLAGASESLDLPTLVRLGEWVSHGDVDGLFSSEVVGRIVERVRPQVRSAGLIDSHDSCWDFFVARARENLHLALCLSPEGETGLRSLSRSVPALVSGCAVHWFRPWPREGLVEVAHTLLRDTPLRSVGASETDSDDEDEVGESPMSRSGCSSETLVDASDDETVEEKVEHKTDTATLRDSLAHHFARVHASADALARATHSGAGCNAATCRRPMCRGGVRAYVTAGAYLDMLSTFRTLLDTRDAVCTASLRSLRSGLAAYRRMCCALDEQCELERAGEAAAAHKRAEADELLSLLGRDSLLAEKLRVANSEESERLAELEEEAAVITQDLQAALMAARPALDAADAALKTLDRAALAKLRATSAPAAEIGQVMSAVLCLTSRRGTRAQSIDTSWAEARVALADPDRLLRLLADLDKDRLPAERVEWARRLCAATDSAAELTPERLLPLSHGAAALCEWVLAVCAYHDAHVEAEPRRLDLEAARASLEEVARRNRVTCDRLDVLDRRKTALQERLATATAEKASFEEACATRAAQVRRAQRLVASLYVEGGRWTATRRKLKRERRQLAAGAAAAAAFAAYAGPLCATSRADLLSGAWPLDIFPRAATTEVVSILSGPARQIAWRSEGLIDSRSLENAAIAERSPRYPLLVDPHLQATAWLAARHRSCLVRVAQDGVGAVHRIRAALEARSPLLIEGVDTEPSVELMPLLYRHHTPRRGGRLVLRLGGADFALSDAAAVGPVFLRTQQSDPHFAPGVQSHLALIDFAVDEHGLEAQFLESLLAAQAAPLASRRAHLESELLHREEEHRQLEGRLLESLASADGALLDDELVARAEAVPAAKATLEAAAGAAKDAEAEVAAIHDVNRTAARRVAITFSLMAEMHRVCPYYLFALDAFRSVVDSSVAAWQRQSYPSESREGEDSKGGVPDGAKVESNSQGEDSTRSVEDSAPGASTVADAAEEGARAEDVSAREECDDAGKQRARGDKLGGASGASCTMGHRRGRSLCECVGWATYAFAAAALPEQQRLAFAAHLALRLASAAGGLTREALEDFVLGPRALATEPQPEALAWLPEAAWLAVQRLAQSMATLRDLPRRVCEETDAWRDWFETEEAEMAALPHGICNLEALLIVRAMRLDRLAPATRAWVEEVLGQRYAAPLPDDLEAQLAHASPAAPLLLLLSPGADPLPAVAACATRASFRQNELGGEIGGQLGIGEGGMGASGGTSLHVVSLLQPDAEAAAERALNATHAAGNWLYLQHADRGSVRWLQSLERQLATIQAQTSEGSQFRLIISVEVEHRSKGCALPEALVRRSVKIAVEPPGSLRGAMLRAWRTVDDELWGAAEALHEPLAPGLGLASSGPSATDAKAAFFGLCHVHSIALARRRYCALGASHAADLAASLGVAARALSWTQVPAAVWWSDLRRNAGAAAFGSHFGNVWDKRLHVALLEAYVHEVSTSRPP
uniref:Uncharacterized protein n=1 Tax=Emiliania huxleyi TaxID=2903 RepID=A0A7S3RXJ4_EMIHU